MLHVVVTENSGIAPTFSHRNCFQSVLTSQGAPALRNKRKLLDQLRHVADTLPPVSENTLLKVHVLAADERLIEAAKSLPQSRFRVEFSTDLDQALKMIASDPCDVAVIDLDLNGFALAKDLRAAPETSATRIVMVCGRFQDRWLCRQAGADEVLIKPIPDVSDLVSAVARLS